VLHGSTYVEVQKDFVEVKFYCQYVVADDTYHIQGEWFEVLLCVVTYSMTVPYRLCTLHLNAVKSFNLGACYSAISTGFYSSIYLFIPYFTSNVKGVPSADRDAMTRGWSLINSLVIIYRSLS